MHIESPEIRHSNNTATSNNTLLKMNIDEYGFMHLKIYHYNDI